MIVCSLTLLLFYILISYGLNYDFRKLNLDLDFRKLNLYKVLLNDGVVGLPEKSRNRYNSVYKSFMEWRSQKNIDSFIEEVLLEYYEELSEKYKSSSLWASYSMLRSTLNINHGINIEHYSNLRAFLKRQSEGYRAKKAKTFSPNEISRFINEAPDHIYLVIKVALIMGILGSCRSSELRLMNFRNIQDLGSALLVTVPSTKTKAGRQFIITGQYYQICKRYIQLRPSNAASMSFFLSYQKGKCTLQNIGINKFGNMGKQIAKFLKLPNSEMYTGHSFRKSSATILVDTGGDMTTLLKKEVVE